MTDHRAAAEQRVIDAHRITYGDANDPATGTALATEALVHATLALVTEIRDWRGDQRIDEPPLVIYRAAYDGIGLGLYTSRDAARDHCLDLAHADRSTALAWVTEAEEDTDELHDASEARVTGYTVSPVDVADVYDPSPDEN